MNKHENERDAIVFLGLMSFALRKFDNQFLHSDQTITHNSGLNVFACITDNNDGELLSISRNQIHETYNPLLHAEQLAMNKAIEKIQTKYSIGKNTISAEKFYREKMFMGDEGIYQGCTLYSTLEPCPYCTSALLVSRMSRVVYFIPDKKFGNSFDFLKNKYYHEYPISFEQLKFSLDENSNLINIAYGYYKQVLSKVGNLKFTNPSLNDTLLLDHMKEILLEISDTFCNDFLNVIEQKPSLDIHSNNQLIIENFKKRLT